MSELRALMSRQALYRVAAMKARAERAMQRPERNIAASLLEK